MPIYIVSGRNIDGKAFCNLSREDFAVIFPTNDKFLLGSNLYRISQKARLSYSGRTIDTQNLIDELSELGDDASFSSAAISRASTPCSSTSS